jgi:hypothetical protein
VVKGSALTCRVELLRTQHCGKSGGPYQYPRRPLRNCIGPTISASSDGIIRLMRQGRQRAVVPNGARRPVVEGQVRRDVQPGRAVARDDRRNRGRPGSRPVARCQRRPPADGSTANGPGTFRDRTAMFSPDVRSHLSRGGEDDSAAPPRCRGSSDVPPPPATAEPVRLSSS